LAARQAAEQVGVERVEARRCDRVLIGRNIGPAAGEGGIEAPFTEQRLESGTGGGWGHGNGSFVRFMFAIVP
jgi:hypothetical protein